MKPAESIFSRNRRYLTDGGLETSLIYHHGVELRHFAAFELLNSTEGRAVLTEYYRPYLQLAAEYNLGFILETPTWRSNADWGNLMGYSRDQLNAINKLAVYFLRNLVSEMELEDQNVILSGNIGPRGDGYLPADCMTSSQAKDYHLEQIKTFAYADADVVTAMTLNYSEEAAGIVKAAEYCGIPAIISFTLETDGRLPNGEPLSEAILAVDKQTSSYASHYMINCAHPDHFAHVLQKDDPWVNRIQGIRANASTKSHQELDACDTLDIGDRSTLADRYQKLTTLLPELRIFGGCCGTDETHMQEICRLLFSSIPA